VRIGANPVGDYDEEKQIQRVGWDARDSEPVKWGWVELDNIVEKDTTRPPAGWKKDEVDGRGDATLQSLVKDDIFVPSGSIVYVKPGAVDKWADRGIPGSEEYRVKLYWKNEKNDTTHYGWMSVKRLINQRKKYAEEAVAAPSNLVLAFYEKDDPYYEFTNYYRRQGNAPLFITVEGRLKRQWKTAEHYFQAMKFSFKKKSDPPGWERILQEATDPHLYTGRQSRPHDSKTDMGPQWAKERDPQDRLGKDPLRPWWHGSEGKPGAKLKVMYNAVKMKFTQDRNLSGMLKNTGKKILVENAGSRDPHWGDGEYAIGGSHGAGTNWGKVAMGCIQSKTNLDEAMKGGTNLLGRLLMQVRGELFQLQEVDRAYDAISRSDPDYNKTSGLFVIKYP
jgi:predicted NAD-dependent protein-ADP-ribosyltransferase YbiA (DUF1768 family)